MTARTAPNSRWCATHDTPAPGVRPHCCDTGWERGADATCQIVDAGTRTWAEVAWDNDDPPDDGLTRFFGFSEIDRLRFRLVDMPVAAAAGNYGTYESYYDEEPERMTRLTENVDSLPPAVFVRTAGGYHHVDGAHRVLVHRHLGRETMPAWVVDAPGSCPDCGGEGCPYCGGPDRDYHTACLPCGRCEGTGTPPPGADDGR